MQNLINIAIFGQDRGAGGADDTRLIFTYPNPNASQMNEAWLRGLFDPRDARDLTNSDNVYALWSSSEGNYYGVIVPANDGRNGRQLLCLHVGKCVSSCGRIVISTLNTLKSLLIDDNLRDRSLIESNLDELVNSLVKDDGVYQKNINPTKAIRQYQTEAQLEQIFSFPKQIEYSNYRCVYAIPSSIVITQQSSFSVITSPIRVIYRVMSHIPNGVSVDKTSISAGGSLNITYKKDGCEPVTKTVVVDGRYDSALYYVENEIYINDSQKAGVKFQRKVKLRFEDASNHSLVRDVTIQLQGGKHTIAKELILNDQVAYKTICIKVLKTGYKTQDVDVTETDILKGNKTIMLEPKRCRIDLCIVTPDGKQTSINTEVNETSALYRHVQHHGLYIHVESNHRPDSNGGEGHKRDIDWWSILSYALWGIIALIILYGGYAAYQLLINDKAPWPFTKEVVEDALEVSISDGDNNQQQEGVAEEDLKADIEYLKTTDNGWNRDNLKTDEYKTLIDNLNQGLCKEAFEHPYKDQSRVNRLWTNVVNIYTKISDKFDDREFRAAIERSKVGSEISVSKLNNEMIELKTKYQHGVITEKNGGTSPKTPAEIKPKPKPDKPKPDPKKTGEGERPKSD